MKAKILLSASRLSVCFWSDQTWFIIFYKITCCFYNFNWIDPTTFLFWISSTSNIAFTCSWTIYRVTTVAHISNVEKRKIYITLKNMKKKIKLQTRFQHQSIKNSCFYKPNCNSLANSFFQDPFYNQLRLFSYRY
jgi:hypothetical protein